MRITEQELNQVFAQFAPRFGGRKEDYFALLYLSKEFGKSVEDVQSNVAFGGNDYGIDAFYIDKERRNLYLYQFKWSKDHSLFKETFKRLIEKGMEKVFGNPQQDQLQNQLILQLKSALIENRAIINSIFIHFIFNGDPLEAERSATLDDLRERLESKKFLIDQFFNREVDLVFEYKSNETGMLAMPAHVRHTYQYRVSFRGWIPFNTPHDDRLYLGFLRLMDLYNMYKDMGIRFFERNIRSGLSPDKPPNRAIRQALKEIVLQLNTPPEVFTFNHNGVTLAAEKVESIGPEEVLLVEPRLLNGAQTITSLHTFLRDNEGNPKLDNNKTILESIYVVAKIIASSKDFFITNVTICNNKQNPVEPWNLRANDLIQLEFQDKFAKELHIYYERQEKMFESLTDEDLEKMGIEHFKAIQIKPLAQTFLAVQGEIDKMSRLGEVFENEKLYRNTFREDYLNSDARVILLAYKIQFRLGRIINEIIAKGSRKYSFVTKARNLIWALLIQAILNDNRLHNLCERYGNSLSMEFDYNDYLKNIASKKIKHILNHAIADVRYQKMLKDETYSFLRTKAFYECCMEFASKRFGWQKRSF